MAAEHATLHRAARATAAVVGVLVFMAAVAYGLRQEPATRIIKPAVPVVPAAPPVAAVRTPTDTPAGTPPVAVVPPSFPPQAADDAELAPLRQRALVLPVEGVAAGQLSDTYTQARAAGAPHEALDIMAARGTPVYAVEDGQIAKLFLSKPGGITVYQFDPDSRYAYYYAHLDRYADGLAEGAFVRKGQVIGYVGSTGNASPAAPHLHFAIFKLGPERQWWKGSPLNPFKVWRD